MTISLNIIQLNSDTLAETIQVITDFIQQNPALSIFLISIPIASVGYVIRQYVIEPRVEKKKANLSVHHENMKAILRKWQLIELKLSKTT